MSYYIGMMSGTSLDAVDAVLAKSEGAVSHVRCHVEVVLPESLKQTLYQLNYPSITHTGGELHTAKIAEHQLTECYAAAYQQLIQTSGVDASEIVAIGAHGQTVRHEPNAAVPYTIQLLNGALLSYLTQQTVVCDFRSKDLAAGGQGAPLAPLFHQQLFSAKPPFAVVNIGGISNISLIDSTSQISGYDCGPGNCLMDEWIAQHINKPFDKDGQWAAQGNILSDLLSRLMADKYFSKPAPKSTGRDYFHLDWLAANLNGEERPVDVMRTLTRLTAISITQAIATDLSTVILAGGGAKNALLVDDIKRLLPSQEITLADMWGIDMQHVEALGFAGLAEQTIERKAVNTQPITGAKEPLVLGAIYPY